MRNLYLGIFPIMGIFLTFFAPEASGQALTIPPSSAVYRGYAPSGGVGSSTTYYYYSDITIFINQAGTGRAITYADHLSQYQGYNCFHSDMWEQYSVAGAPNAPTFTYSPSVSAVGQPVFVVLVMIGRTRHGCDHTTDPNPDERFSNFNIYTVQPGFVNQSSLVNLCQSGSVVQLSDYFQGDLFSSMGFYLDDPYQSTPAITALDPSKIAPGDHFVYVHKLYGNGNYDDKIPIHITASVPIYFSAYPATVCANSGIVNIQATPKGGSWSGNGIDKNGNFTPSSAGVGAQDETYSYVDPSLNKNPSGCASTKTLTITVKAAPIVDPGQPIVICHNGNPVALSDGTPSGGTWTGLGVSSNTFSPASVSPGSYLATYTYTDASNGCSASADKQITVKPLPVVIAGLDKTVCSGDAAFDLSADASPTGGIFSGTGVSSNSFDPAVSGAGAFKITYTYTDPQSSCIVTASRQITVKQAPAPVAPANKTVCQNTAPFPLQGGSPTGGTYSGLGVANDIFSPSVAGPGNTIITYTYTDPITKCSGSTSFIITINALPTVVAGAGFSVCINGGSQALAGSPAGGAWSGQGVSGTLFDPKASGLGTFILHYTFSDPNTGCTNSDSLKAIVKPIPQITVPSDSLICINAPLVKLVGQPSSGTWSGQGVTSSSFDPKASGVGTFTLTYTFQDPVTNCSNQGKFNITVRDVPQPIAPANFDICLNASPLLLQGATPLGGVYSGQGVTNGIFNPKVAGVGNQTITYSFKDPNTSCTGYTSFIILVKPIPAVYAGPSFHVCVNGGLQPLSGQPSGGTWSGQGVSSGVFDPSVSGSGKFILTYSYTDGSSSCSNSDTISALVYPLPVLNVGSDSTICQNSGLLALKGLPSGGTWTGTGIYGNNFYPTQGQIGINPLTYTYSDGNGCQTTAVKKITVLPFTPVTVGSPVTMCLNSGPYDLTKDASIQGGIWSGRAVNGGFFTPSSAGIGTFILTYSYQNLSGCVTSAQKQVTVLGIPGKVTISGGGGGCNGSVLTLYAQQDSATNYQWYHINDKVPFATGASLNYTITSTEQLYCVGVNQLNCGISKLAATTVQITSLSPKADLISSQTAVPFGGLVQFTASNNYNVQNYQWTFGDGGLSTEKNPSHYYYQKGLFHVSLVLTSPEGCSDSTSLKSGITVGSDDSLSVAPGLPRPGGIDNSSFPTKVYPSPFSDHVFIICHLTHPQKIFYTLYDTYGRMLRQGFLDGVSGDNKFSILNLDKLVIKNYYMMILKSDELSDMIKILKM